MRTVLEIRSRTWLTTLLAAMLACCYSAAAASAQAETTILAGQVAPGPPEWPLYVAQELGYLKAGGVSVETYNSGSNTAQELVVGALNISHSGFPDFMRATYNGAAVKIIIGTVSLPPYTVYAKRDIKEISQLKGKVISIGGVHDVTLIYMKNFFASAGLNSSNVGYVYAKSANERFASLVAGGVDAAILNPPTSFRAAALGFSNLGEISSAMKDFPFTVWAVNTDWASKNRGALTVFAKSYQRSVDWLYDPANEQRAINILIKYAKVDEKDATSSYDYLITQLHAFNRSGLITETTFQKMTDALLELGDIKKPVPPLQTFFDASFLQSAKQQQ